MVGDDDLFNGGGDSSWHWLDTLHERTLDKMGVTKLGIIAVDSFSISAVSIVCIDEGE